MNLVVLTAFFGWMTLLNLGIYLIHILIWICWKKAIMAWMHTKWFGVDPQDLPEHTTNYFARYEILVAVFNFVPYIVLQLLM